MKNIQNGFTLIETLVAISLLTVSIVAPITLAAQSLNSAYYARDQITAFYMAQEAIEALRSVRDAQILQISQSSSGSSINIFGPIPLGNQPFAVDAHYTDSPQAIHTCGATCPPLQTDGTLYGYESNCAWPTADCESDDVWKDTEFTRTVKAAFVGASQDEIRVTVIVTWHTGPFQTRTFSISENMYRWVQDGSAA